MATADDSLYWACFHGSKHQIIALANQNNVSYVRPHFGDTPLHQACKQGWLDIVEMLIEKYDCDPNAVTKSGERLLHYACQYGHTGIVTLLIEEYGCDPNAVTESGESLLYYACRYGHTNIVMLLIEKYGCDPNAMTKSGESLLYYACQFGHTNIVMLLIEKYGCDLNAVTESGESLLHYACQCGHTGIVMLLIEENGCDPNAVTESGESLLYYTCRYGNTGIVTLLIEKYDCDPNAVTERGESLLHYACRYGHTGIVMLLIEEYGCDPNAVTASGESLLYFACRYGHIDVVKLLIEEYGCDPNVVAKSNQTLLHYACQCGNIYIVKYLINKQHLNPLIRDSINQSEPLDYAVNNNQYSIAVYLCQHISSDEMLSPNRIETTINLIKFIILRMVYGSIMWKTANGDNILQLVGSSKMHIAYTPSAVILKSISCNASCIVEYFKPDLKTADGDTILQLVCQSETLVSQISSVVMMKWLSDSTDLMKIDTLKGTTADGYNLLELICQSEKCLIQISSTVFFMWLRENILGFVITAIPDCKTADGDTLLELILQSEMSISRIFSKMLAKLLSNSRKIFISELKNVNPNWKTADGAHFPHVLCLSNIEISKVTKLIQYYIVENGWNPDTSDTRGNTILHIACHTDKLALVSYLIDQAQCNPSIENSDESLPVDMTANLEIINCVYSHNRVSVHSKTIAKWLSNPMFINNKIILYNILHSLVDNHKIITEDGSTLLHVVCTCSTSRDKQRLINYLLTECQCDPNCSDSKGRMPIQFISDLRIMKTLIDHGADMTIDVAFKLISKHTDFSVSELFKLLTRKGTMLQNPNDLNSDGYTALHLACTIDNFTIVNYLLSVAHCDPNIKSKNDKMSIQVTSDLRILKTLIEHGAQMTTDVVFELISKWLHTDSRASELFELLTNKGTRLRNPNNMNSDGYTALHLACVADRFTIVNYLLSVAHCDPNIKSKNEEVPIQLTSDLRIMKALVEYGAQMTMEVVFKLISKRNTDYKLCELLRFSTTKGTLIWNPNDLNSDGYTALHLACKADSCIIVNYLLSVAHCDPNIKSNSEEVPLQMTTNTEVIKDLMRHGAKTSIMYKSYKKALGTNKPLQPPVKVFIVGNPSVGKSTLTAALKKEKRIIAQFFSSGKVSGVDEKTVGIVPHDLESGHFGRVTLYDFAGHREFYSGHAALLQTAIQSSPPIFLLVVKLSKDDNEIIKNILYWILFLENQCASITCRPHIILVGSHADALEGINPKDKVKSIITTLDTKCFTNMECIGFVTMNCQLHESTGMSDLRRLLIKSCQELRIKEPITFNAHCFLVYLIDKFINVTAVTIKTVSETINN